MLRSKDVKYCQEYTCQLSGMWTVAIISPVTFSEVRLRSAADSNMAVAAVARVHVLARPSVWQADDFDVLNMSYTQKRPEIVRNTGVMVGKLDSNILFAVGFFLRQCKACIYEHCQLSNHGPTNNLSMIVSVTVLTLLLSCLDWLHDSLIQKYRTWY